MQANHTESLELLNYTQYDIKNVISDLNKFGYAKLDNVIPHGICSSLSKTFDELRVLREQVSGKECSEATREEKRFVEASGQVLLRDILFQRPDVLLPFLNLPPVMEVVSEILDDVVILDAHSASNSCYRDPLYRRSPTIHVDSPLAIRDITQTTHIAAMICVEDFTAGNGGTRVWPGSHKSGIVVHKTPGYSGNQIPGHVEIHANKGSILFLLGQTWHQVGTNIDDSSRWAMIIFYTRWWVKPATDYTQCGEDLFNLCSTEQKSLLGFASKPPQNRMLRHKMLVNPDDISQNYNEAARGGRMNSAHFDNQYC